MKISNSTIFLLTLIFLTLASVKQIYAQESGSPSFESYDNDATNGSERVFTSPRESIESSKSPSKSTAHPVLQLDNTDSVVMRFQTPPARTTPAQQKASNKSKDDDDSILSFNFLYYLIERYKLQDIIE